MKLTILYLTILTVMTSCNGQTTTQQVNSEKLNDPIAKGESVKELSSNIMVIYQDRKNNYWFGSWQDGVYKYDGKSIINYKAEHGLPHNRIDEIKEDISGNLYFNSCSPVSTVTKFDGKQFTPANCN